MTEISANVKVDLSGLEMFREAIDAQLQHRQDGEITKAFRQWGARYRSAMKERFDAFSKGGGDWPPLNARTIARRRPPAKRRTKGAKEKIRKVAILRDTGTLFAALAPALGKPGQLEAGIPFGIEVGYGGRMRHPKGHGVSIADIASFHQNGAGYLPARKIIVQPAQPTLEGMSGDMMRALKRLANDGDNLIRLE